MRNPWEEEQLQRLYLQAVQPIRGVFPSASCSKWRTWKRAVENLFSHFPQFVWLLSARRKKAEALIAASVNGGVGDLIRFNAFFVSLVQQYPNVKIDIYTAHPAAKFVFAKLPGVRVIAPERLYPWFAKRYDAYFNMGQIVVPTFHTDVFPMPCLRKVADEWSAIVSKHWQQYQRVFFPELIRLAEQRNWNFLEMLGRTGGLVGVGQARAKIYVKSSPNPLAGKKYITFNTGWNKNDKLPPGVARHTKCWPEEHWRAWVRLFRKAYPHIDVVQLGENNAPRIVEANTTLLGRTTLNEVSSVLKDSLLHVDCDCGLMHLSYALGVPAVILFGPTNGSYLTYPNQVVLLAPRCGNCWHLTRTWDYQCPLYPQPVCMSSITPQMLQDTVAKQLK